MSKSFHADGPAISEPSQAADHYTDSPHGMYLRDYFAAKAMQGLLSSEKQMEYCTEVALDSMTDEEIAAGLNDEDFDLRTDTNPFRIMAECAYKIADWMLAAREKGANQ